MITGKEVISFETAKSLYKQGFAESTDLFYLVTQPGIRAVLSDPEGKVVSEQVFYYGCLEKKNEDLGVTFPSPHWIPAPFVMDVIPWLDGKGIRIEPHFNEGCYTFSVKYADKDVQDFGIKSYTIENCYLNAIIETIKIMMETN